MESIFLFDPKSDHEVFIPFILITTALRQSIVVKILIVIKHRCAG